MVVVNHLIVWLLMQTLPILIVLINRYHHKQQLPMVLQPVHHLLTASQSNHPLTASQSSHPPTVSQSGLPLMASQLFQWGWASP